MSTINDSTDTAVRPAQQAAVDTPTSIGESTVQDIPEGHLPPGIRPAPGARGPRRIWTGEEQAAQENAEDPTRPVEIVEHAGGQTNGAAASWPSRRTVRRRARQGGAVYKLQTRDGRRTQRRVMGIDVARGVALFGMVAIHTLPAWSEAAQGPTVTWTLFAGHSAALFAVLAGLSLALLTGGRRVQTGRRGLRSRVGLVLRAVLLLVAGLALNLMWFPAYNILPYYGLLFLLAVPLTLMRAGGLIVSAVVLLVGSPFLTYLVVRSTGAESVINPSLVDLFADPLGVTVSLLLTGSYPAVTWMAFICLGMALGRLPLHRERVQIGLLISGAVLAVSAYAASALLIFRLGGMQEIVSRTPGATPSSVEDVMIFGPEPTLPTTTLWWLAIDGPHTNTPFAVALSGGIALAALGALLLVSRLAGRWLRPVAAVGSMTLTFYTAHLVFLSWVDVEATPWFWFGIQMAVAIVAAMAWQRASGRGPLERLLSLLCAAPARLIVPRSQAEAARADDVGSPPGQSDQHTAAQHRS